MTRNKALAAALASYLVTIASSAALALGLVDRSPTMVWTAVALLVASAQVSGYAWALYRQADRSRDSESRAPATDNCTADSEAGRGSPADILAFACGDAAQITESLDARLTELREYLDDVVPDGNAPVNMLWIAIELRDLAELLDIQRPTWLGYDGDSLDIARALGEHADAPSWDDGEPPEPGSRIEIHAGRVPEQWTAEELACLRERSPDMFNRITGTGSDDGEHIGPQG